ncbi:hypothetical protein [Massilia sp. YIM B04103]|uniref:hypothetical protein n=1 Tax=Massilia sp. YIM B04103 TaxID=2963106 RepID=UPI00210C5820|nr:hypothetical protein [Massilia sp. YIM B04103]
MRSARHRHANAVDPPGASVCTHSGVARPGYEKVYPCIVRVEIVIYRGQLNPSWDLTDQESDALQMRLHTLPRTGMAAFPNKVDYPALRIRAFDVPNNMLSGSGSFMTVELNAGLVRLQHGDGTIEYCLDADQSIARWLLSLAQGRTDEAIRQAVLARIAARCS